MCCYSIPKVKEIIENSSYEGVLKRNYVDLFGVLDQNGKEPLDGIKIKCYLKYIGEVNAYSYNDMCLRKQIRSVYLDIYSCSPRDCFFSDERIYNSIVCHSMVPSNDFKAFLLDYAVLGLQNGMFDLEAIIEYDDSKSFPVVSLYMRCKGWKWYKYSLNFHEWYIESSECNLPYGHDKLNTGSRLTRFVYKRI